MDKGRLSRCLAKHAFLPPLVVWVVWKGFGVAEIGGTPPNYDDWKPRGQGYDDDGDVLSNEFEDRMQSRFYCAPRNRFSIIEWWTGIPGSSLHKLSEGIKEDSEMLVRLWSDWGGCMGGLYIIGSLDDKDWSVGGRQDHW